MLLLPPTKVQEGNIFNPVCVSVHGEGNSCMRNPPSQGMFKVFHYGSRTIGKAGDCQLKCLLVLHNFYLDYTEACLKDDNHLQAMVKIALYFFYNVFFDAVLRRRCAFRPTGIFV